MRGKKSIYNILAASVLQGINLIINIILPKIILLKYGSNINGLVSSIKQFIGYFNLVEAGLAGASAHSLYQPLIEKNEVKINKILSASNKFYNKSGRIFLILTLILMVIFPQIIKNEGIGNSTIRSLVLILGINGSLEFFTMGKYRALLTADQKNYIISIIQGVGVIFNATIISIMALSGYNIVIVQLVASISYLVRGVLFSIYTKKYYKFLNFKELPDEKSLQKRWDVLFHQIAAMIVFNSPVALITIFCSLKEVSVYTVYNTVFVGIGSVIAIFSNGLMAGFGQLLSQKKDTAFKETYNQYEFGFYMIVAWMYASTSILIMPFIEVYTKGINDANYIRPEISILFIAVGILNTMRTPQITIVNAAGHFKETRGRAIAELSINLILSVIFVNIWGVSGVLLGSIFSYAYRTIDLIQYVPQKITHISVAITIRRIIRIVLSIVIVNIPFIKVRGLSVEGFPEWILYAIVVSIWSAIVVFSLNYILEKNVFKKTVRRIKNIIIKS